MYSGIILFLALIVSVCGFPSGTLADSATVSLSPASGVAGTFVTVTGSGLAASVTGTIWFDTNGDGLRNNGEAAVYGTVTTDAGGAIPAGTVLDVPAEVGTGTYTVQVDLPGGGDIEASSAFSVNAGILLHSDSGIPGVTTFITGSGFSPGTTGAIWFDTDNNAVLDSGEPSVSVTTDAVGAVPLLTRLTVPSAAVGACTVRADIPNEGGIEASATFAINSSGIIASHTYGGVATGSGFSAGTSFNLWIDRNRNGGRDSGETYKSTATTLSGTIPDPCFIPGPNAPAGIYRILFDLGCNGSIDCSAGAVISPTIALVAPYAPAGSVLSFNIHGFPASSTGDVWFDTNLNGAMDAGEPATTGSSNLNGLGSVYTFGIPDVPPGAYRICADIPTGGPVEASAAFAVRGITLAPGSGTGGTAISAAGIGFVPGKTGYVWFDSDGDSTMDADEPQAAATADTGSALPPVSLTAPSLAGGSYHVRADVPSGSTVESSAVFTLLGPPTAAFTCDVPSGTAPLTVSFADQSAGSPTSWAWDFDNDGTADSTEQNPAHVYSSAGTYTVALTAANEYGGDIETRMDCVTVALPTHTITASAGANGSIDPAGEVAVDEGDSQSFIITPVAGCHVVDVLVDGTSVGAVTSYEFAGVTANHTISVTFDVDQPAWDLNGDGQCNIGDVVVIGLKWGQTGSPGWIPEDLNNDGEINIGDVVLIGLHWGGTW